jgi:hypothetical protein
LNRISLDWILVIYPLWKHNLEELDELGNLFFLASKNDFLLMTIKEILNLKQFIFRSSQLENAKATRIADCGVYNGGSIYVLASYDPIERQIEVFDTFEGLYVSSIYDQGLTNGEF